MGNIWEKKEHVWEIYRKYGDLWDIYGNYGDLWELPSGKRLHDWLVVEPTPLKNRRVNWDDDIPN